MHRSLGFRLPGLALLLTLAVACGGGDASTEPPPPPPPPPPVTPTNVSIAPAAVQFEAVGSSIQLAATFTPGGATGTVSWRSANSAVATVSGNGMTATVVAIAPGTTQIIASVGAIEGSSTVTVPEVPQEVEEDIGAAGGELAINSPGHPFTGLRVTVPDGAFTGSSTWRVRTDTTTLLAFPAGATVDGPGLEIEAPSGLTADGELITMRIPVTPKPGFQTVIALVDPISGAFDLLPLVDRDANSVTVVTRHLESARVARSSTTRMSAARIAANGAINISRIRRLLLANGAVLNATGSFSPGRHAWPVAENGSAAFPDGHGSAISALQRVAAMIDVDVASTVKPLGSKGFYADSAALAMAMLAAVQQKKHELTIQAVAQISRGGAGPTRDSLAATNIGAGIAMNREPQLFLKLSSANAVSDIRRHAWAVATSIQNGIVKFVDPTAPGQIRDLSLTASGFAPIASRTLVSDAIAESKEVFIPMPAALMPDDELEQPLRDMIAALGATGAERESRTQALVSAAGIQSLQMQLKSSSNTAFAAVKNVARVMGDSAGVRIVGGSANAALAILDPDTGEEVRRVASGTTLAVSLLPGIREAAAGIATIVKAVAIDVNNGRQIIPFSFSVSRGEFAIEEDTVHLRDSTLVRLAAELTGAPEEGYRVTWTWGDGSSPTVNLSLPTAMHLYTRVDTFQVVATMRTVDEPGEVLAVDSAVVITYPQPYWVITSMTDPGGFLQTFWGQQENILLDIMANPARGIVAMHRSTDGPQVTLSLYRRNSGTWNGLQCCRLSPRAFGGLLSGSSASGYGFGQNPATTTALGPAFSAFASNGWSQSSTDLITGTMTGQWHPFTRSYQVEGGGTQVGPTYVQRFVGTRNGDTLTGRFEMYRFDQFNDRAELYGFSTPTGVIHIVARRMF